MEVVRDTCLDDVLDEYLSMMDGTTGQDIDAKIPRWRLVAGAEGVKFPYGARVEGYRFVGNVADFMRGGSRSTSGNEAGIVERDAELAVAPEPARSMSSLPSTRLAPRR